MKIKCVKKLFVFLWCLFVLIPSVQTYAAETGGEDMVPESGMRETVVHVTVEKQEEKPVPAPQYHETTNIIKETTETILREKILGEKEADEKTKGTTQETTQGKESEREEEQKNKNGTEETENAEERKQQSDAGNGSTEIEEGEKGEQHGKENLEKTSKQSSSFLWIFAGLLFLAVALLIFWGLKHYKEKNKPDEE